jgi:hypothetical protein
LLSTQSTVSHTCAQTSEGANGDSRMCRWEGACVCVGRKGGLVYSGNANQHSMALHMLQNSMALHMRKASMESCHSNGNLRLHYLKSFARSEA